MVLRRKKDTISSFLYIHKTFQNQLRCFLTPAKISEQFPTTSTNLSTISDHAQFKKIFRKISKIIPENFSKTN